MMDSIEIRRMLLACTDRETIYINEKFGSRFFIKPTKDAYIKVPKKNWETIPYFMPDSIIHVYIDKIESFKELLFLLYMVDKNKMEEVRNDGLINKFNMIHYFIANGFDLIPDIQIHYDSENWIMDYKNRKYDPKLHEFINKDMEEEAIEKITTEEKKMLEDLRDVYWDSFTNTFFCASSRTMKNISERLNAAFDESEKTLKDYREKMIKKQEEKEKMNSKDILHIVYADNNYLLLSFIGAHDKLDDDPVYKTEKWNMQYLPSKDWTHTVFILGERISKFLNDVYEKMGDPVALDYIPHIAINIAEDIANNYDPHEIYSCDYDFSDPDEPELIQNGE